MQRSSPTRPIWATVRSRRQADYCCTSRYKGGSRRWRSSNKLLSGEHRLRDHRGEFRVFDDALADPRLALDLLAGGELIPG